MKLGLLVFFAANTLAAPFLALDKDLPGAKVTGLGCKSTRFAGRGTFTYDYEGETSSTIEGATTKSTALKIKTRVAISTVGECNFIMEVSNTQLWQKSMGDEDKFLPSPDTLNFKGQMEKYDTFFTMSGNHISSLFSNQDEPVFILNVKRGILSALQVDEQVATETDVNGDCPTRVVLRDNKIIETKTLSECTDRATQEIGIQASSIRAESNLNVLRSDSKCVYTMDGQTIKRAECKETHLFRPFSAGYKGASGAVTTVKQSLTRVEGAPTRRNVRTFKTGSKVESSLLFDHTDEEKTSTRTMSSAFEQVMHRLVKPSSLGSVSAKQDSAHEFSTLVFLLRKMDSKRMKHVWQKFYDCKDCTKEENDLYRQYLLDAISYCGSTTCISTVSDVISKEENGLSGERMNIFLQSIAFVGKTSKRVVRDLVNIVKEKPSRQAYLTLGTVLKRHCDKFPQECQVDKRNPITLAEDYLLEQLGDGCSDLNITVVERNILALKSMANAQRPLRATQAILKCARNSRHTNLTRAAFDALKQMPCNSDKIDALYHFARDTTYTPEKRISSFVALMKCPNEKILDHMVHMLQEEPSEQVASFVWSYLTNVRESNNPAHRNTQELLKKLEAAGTKLRTMDMPYHQFSRAYEKSVYSDSLKSGAAVESHVIFDNHRYFPKTAFFDLTAQVLGVPVSLLETNIGIEGMEEILEQAVSKDGIMPIDSDWIANIFNMNFTAEQIKRLTEPRDGKIRRRRAVDIDGKIDQIHDDVKREQKAPNGHISFKVMGQEIRTFSYDDIWSTIEEIDNMNVIDLLIKIANGVDKTFTKSVMFLEMSQNVPTGAGLPLRLKLVGSTVTSIEMKGKFDIRNMFWSTKGSMNVKGHVKPSSSVEITGEMGVDAHYATSGVFVNSSMYVSNLMKGEILYKGGKIFKLNMDAPEEPVELFKVGSTPFMYLNGNSEPIEGVAYKIDQQECVPSVMLGYGICMNLRVPLSYREYEAPYFPLSGPANFGLKLFRADEKLKFYQFLMSLNTNKQTATTTGTIEFSTPGATYERRIGADLLLTDVDKTKTLTLSTKKFGKTASVSMSFNSKTFTTSLKGSNNLFNGKDLITGFEFFNEKAGGKQELGVLLAAEYDWYKLEHITKVVRVEDTYTLVTNTLYYPGKRVGGEVEYDSVKRQITSRLNMPWKQYTLTSTLEQNGEERGIRITTSDRNTFVYAAVVNAETKKALIVSAEGIANSMRQELVYTTTDDKVSLTDIITVNGKVSTVNADFISNDVGTSADFTADIVGNKAASKFSFLNTIESRELKMVASAADKSMESSLKLNMQRPELIASMNVNGKKMSAFVKSESHDGYKVSVGGNFGKYKAGLREVYTKGQGHVNSVCTLVYYGMEGSAEKIPGEICAEYHSLGKDFVHKKFVLAFDSPQFGKKGAITVNLEKHVGHIKTLSEIKWDNKQLIQEIINVKYNSWTDCLLSFDYLVAEKYTLGASMFSRHYDGETRVGFEMASMGKSFSLLNKITKPKMITEIIVNGRVLPVSTELSYINTPNMKGPVVQLNLGEYSAAYTQTLAIFSGNYELGVKLALTKSNQNLFTVYKSAALGLENTKQSIRMKYGLLVDEKTYEYGYEGVYQNMDAGKKTSRAVTLRSHYSTDRSSAVTFTFTNRKADTTLAMDVEYIPLKFLNHELKFTKAINQIDLSIEFLPKMFSKSLVRLEKSKGYRLVAKSGVEWDNFRRYAKAVYGYKSNDNKIAVIVEFGKDVSFSAALIKSTPRVVELKYEVFGKRGEFSEKLTTKAWQKKITEQVNMLKEKVVNIDTQVARDYVDMGKKKIEEYLGEFEEIKKKVQLQYSNELKEMKSQVDKYSGDVKEQVEKYTGDLKVMKAEAEQKYAEMEGKFNELKNKIKFVYYLENDELVFSVSNKEQEYVAINGKLNRKGQQLTSYIRVMGVERLAVDIGIHPTSVYLTLKPENFEDITLKAAYAEEKKRVSLIGEYGDNEVKADFQADIDGKTFGTKFFLNHNVVGVKFSVDDKNALTARVILGKDQFLQLVFKFVNDNTLKVLVQSVKAGVVTTHTSFKYKLSKDLCTFAFNWNTKTLKKIVKLVKSIAEVVMKKSKKYSKVAYKRGEVAYKNAKQVVVAYSDEANEMSAEMMKMVEQRWDQIDFVEMKNNMGRTLFKTLKKLEKSLRQALMAAANNIDELKKRIPELTHKAKLYLKQAHKMTKDLRKYATDMQEDLKQAVEDLKKSTKQLQELVKVLATEVQGNWKQVATLVTKVATNITESSHPVVVKAIQLLRNFKVQGKTFEEIIMLGREKGQEYFDIYSKKAGVQFTIVKGQAMDAMKEGTKYILKVKIPYRDETVEEMLEIIVKKVKQVKKDVVEKSRSVKKMFKEFDVEETAKKVLKEMKIEESIEKVRVAVMEYKINTIPVKERIVLLRKDIEKLPERVQVLIKQLYKLLKQLQDQSVVVLDKVNKFSKPLVKYAKLVQTSVNKHFSPLVSKAMRKLMAKIPDFEKVRPTLEAQWKEMEEIFMPLVNNMGPMYEDMKKQVLQFEINGFRVVPMIKMQLKMIEQNARKYVKLAKARFNAEIIRMEEQYKQFAKFTPKELANQFYDMAVIKNQEARDYLVNQLAEQKKVMDVYMKKIQVLYAKFNSQWEKLSRQSFEEIIETTIHQSSENILVTAEKLASLLRDVAEMELVDAALEKYNSIDLRKQVLEPAMKKWEEADVHGKYIKPLVKKINDMDIQGRVEKLKLKERFNKLVKASQKLEFQQKAMKAYKDLKKLIADIYAQMFVRAIKIYNKAEKTVKYIKSIPRKEYEQWFNEMKQTAAKYNAEMTGFAEKVFNMENKDKIVKFVTKTWNSNKAEMVEMIKTTYKTSQENAEEYYRLMSKMLESYKQSFETEIYQPAQDWAKLVGEKSELVYADLKQPTAEVYAHYNGIAMEYYSIVEAGFRKQYATFYVRFMEQFEELMKQFGELKLTVYKQLNAVFEKYADMTWEQIAKEAYKVAKENGKVVRKNVKKMYKQMQKTSLVYKQKLEKIYREIVAMYEKYLEKFETELKPKAMKIYRDYKTMTEEQIKMVKEKIELLKQKVEVLREMANKQVELLQENVEIVKQGLEDLRMEAIELYKQNKHKTIKQIYLELKEFIEKEITKQVEIMKAQYKIIEAQAVERVEKLRKMSEEKYEELKKMSEMKYEDLKKLSKEKFEEVKDMSIAKFDEAKELSITKFQLIKEKIIKELKALKKRFDAKFKEYKKICTEKCAELKKEVMAQVAVVKEFVDNYYEKADVLVRTVIIPEVRAETVSLINQSLRASVIMFNETVAAFTPHYNLIKEFTGDLAQELSKLAAEMKINVIDASKKINKQNVLVIQENMVKLYDLLREMIEKLKNHELVKKYMNHELVVKAKAQYKKYVELVKKTIHEIEIHSLTIEYKTKIEDMIAKGKEYLKELRSHPEVLKIEGKIKEVIAQLKEYLKELESTYETYSKHPKVAELKKLAEQLQTSSLFTLNEVVEKVEPQMKKAIVSAQTAWNTMPSAKNHLIELAVMFRQYPEETFWNTWKVTSEVIIPACLEINYVKIATSFFEDVKAFFEKEFTSDMFDEWTKTTFADAVEAYKKLSKRAAEIAVNNYKWCVEKLEELKEQATEMYIVNYQNSLKIIEKSVKYFEVLLAKLLKLRKQCETLENCPIYKKAMEMYADAKENLPKAMKRCPFLTNPKEYISVNLKKCPYFKQAMKMYTDSMEYLPEALKRCPFLANPTEYLNTNMKKCPVYKRAVIVYKQVLEMVSDSPDMPELPELSTFTDNAIVNNPIWRELKDEVNRHELVVLAKILAKITREQYAEMKAKYTEFAGPLQKRVMKFGTDLKEMSYDKYTTSQLNEKYAEARKQYDDVRTTVEKKYSETKEIALARHAELEKEVREKYAWLIQMYKDNLEFGTQMYDLFWEQVEEYTEKKSIADIVEEVKVLAKYTETIVKNMSEEAMKLKAKYVDELIAAYKKYSKQAVAMYSEYKQDAEEIFEEFKSQAVDMIKKYKQEFMPYYKQYKKEGMVLFKKYYPLAMEKYNELYAKSMELRKEYTAVCEKYYEEAKKIFEDVYAKAETRYNEMKTKSEELYKVYNKEAMYEYATSTRDELKKKWEESEMLVKLMAVQKMTVRQTARAILNKMTEVSELVVTKFDESVEFATATFQSAADMALKYKQVVDKMLPEYKQMMVDYIKKVEKLFNEYKQMSVKEFRARYQKLNREAMELFEQKYAETVKLYAEKRAEAVEMFNQRYEKLSAGAKRMMKQAIKQKDEFVRLATPYVEPVVAVYSAVAKEVTESALFVYRYYGVGEEIEAVKQLVVREYNRVKPIVEAMVKKYRQIAEKSLDEYKLIAMEKVEELKALLEEYKKLAEIDFEMYKVQAQQYFEEYKQLAKVKFFELKEAAIFSSVKYSKMTGDFALRSFHAGMKYFDNVTYDKFVKDLEKLIDEIKAYLKNIDVVEMKADLQKMMKKYTPGMPELPEMPDLKQYVSVDTANGEILVNIPHNFPGMKRQVEEMGQQMKKQLKRVRKDVNSQYVAYKKDLQKQLKDVKQEMKEKLKSLEKQARQSLANVKGSVLVQKIKKQLVELRKKIEELKNQLSKMVMSNTVELRTDLRASYDANAKLVQQIYKKAKIVGQIVYKRAQGSFTALSKDFEKFNVNAKALAEKYYTELSALYKKVFVQVSEFIEKFNANPRATMEEVYTMSLKEMKQARRHIVQFYKENKPVVMKRIQTLRKEAVEAWKRFLKNVDATSQLGKMLLNEFENSYSMWQSGVAFDKAFYPIIRQAQFMIAYFHIDYTMPNMCRDNPKICNYARQSIKVHSTLADKYASRAVDSLQASEVVVLRSVRKAARLLNNKKEAFLGPSYPATALIYGKKHMITFDNKAFDMVDFPKRDCTYMLAHDFVYDSFSIMSQQDSVIVKTEGMTIKIKSDGRTKTTIGGKSSNSLPVQSSNSKCFRLSNTVKCEFADEGVFVMVDLTNFNVMIQLSSWHHGKTQGLLGTNNRDRYDEMILPDGSLAKDVYEFANAYELTGKRMCVARPPKQEAKCKKAASPKCNKLFTSANSIFAEHFMTVDPTPFLKACEDDTSCGNVGHCSSVAAYSSMLRAQGEQPKHCPDCVKVTSHKLGEEWTQKPTGEMDVVVLVSEQQKSASFKKQLMKILIQLQAKIRVNKLDSRYALVGFGGKGVHEHAHIHPIGLGDDVFGSMKELTKEIKSMRFTGGKAQTNDAMNALVMASRLPLRPGSSRMFVLYNEQQRSAGLFAITEAEVQQYLTQKANAHLYVFENNMQKDLIGETAKKVYTKRSPQGSPNKQGLITSPFSDLITATDGGAFTTQTSSLKLTSQSLFDAMTSNINRHSMRCQTCIVKPRWNGQAKAICRPTQC